MAAISKCNGNNCDVKEFCRRYTEPSSPMQSFCAFQESEDFNPMTGCRNIWLQQDFMDEDGSLVPFPEEDNTETIELTAIDEMLEKLGLDWDEPVDRLRFALVVRKGLETI